MLGQNNITHDLKNQAYSFTTSVYRAYEQWKQEQGLTDQSPVRRDVAFPVTQKTVKDLIKKIYND